MQKLIIFGCNKAPLQNLGSVQANFFVVSILSKFSERPLVFSTKIAATFKRIKKKDFAHMSSKRFPIYEKVIQGVIHVRTDGKKLVLGRVYGNTKLASPENPNGYKWEYYLFDLK